jgi:hypothetical protein
VRGLPVETGVRAQLAEGMGYEADDWEARMQSAGWPDPIS